ncbi:hypothetical protein NLU13_7875 [Sarocladium strictum]|uniref:Zn(2)-C6 fungal-type domain-containing protein n=1 Tax=Sarocladium strictum TaxID=5046 RepID=A0AA39L686_SARSR|nr:hypothetical protein NLU13_7875 [Sarocladium strictum]
MASARTASPLSPVPLVPHPGRRRDKPQLSCYLCRRRKKKCDRQLPCSTCRRLDVGHDCRYTEDAVAARPKASQGAYRPLAKLPATRSEPTNQDQGDHGQLRAIDQQSFDNDRSCIAPSAGNLRINKFENNFKDGSHWTSVLHRATSLTGQEGELDEAQVRESQLPTYQTVLLFSCGKEADEKEIIAGLPSRKICDDLVSSYFHLLDHSCFLHAKEFLRNYHKFWQDPHAAPASWLGLLYSTMCIAAQFKSPCPRDCACGGHVLRNCGHERLMTFREKTVQCLLRAQYGRGGPFIMETLLHYFMMENYLRRDSNTGLWLLLGSIVQIAIRMGYHRDPSHFKSLSPYEGEMRRRVWTHCFIFDAVLATQLGLPTVIRQSICDTQPPRNISDKDYDSTARSLPPARPDGEVTQSTITIAKFRLAKTLTEVSDALSCLRPYSLADAMRIDKNLCDVYQRLPSTLKHRPLSESILDSRITVFQRINIKLACLRGRMLLHWKFVAEHRDSDQYGESRTILVNSAMESLELQQLTVDELRPHCQIAPIYLYDSAIVNHTHLLATSVLCFYIRYLSGKLATEQLAKIRLLLQGAQAIWQRSSNDSVEAQRAAGALATVLARTTGEQQHAAPYAPELAETSSEDTRELLNWPQLPFTYTNGFDKLPQMTVGENAAFLYPPSISPLDSWASFI